MIRDLPRAGDFPKEAEALHEGGFAFYLTGSRYFGCALEWSDWDFMVEDTPDVRQYLENCGFVPQWSDLDYITKDSLTNDVWVLPAQEFEGPVIQVQLVHTVETKRKARDLIVQHHAEYHKLAESPLRTMLWNEAIAFATPRTIEEVLF